jgi:hypothetical protein
MVLDYDVWHNQKLPCGILIEFWKHIYIGKLVAPTYQLIYLPAYLLT